MKRYLIILLSVISLAGFSQFNVSDGGLVYSDSLEHVQPGSISVGNSYTFTICASDGYDDHHISIAFPSDFNIPSGSNLCVYDGPDVGSPLIACYNNTNFGATHAFMATCANITGCLTLVLDAQDAGISFDGIVHDQFCCQDIQINLTTSPTMIGQNIDICPGDDVTLTAGLSFPTYTALQATGHDWGYTQNAGTCNFNWDMDDGTSASTASVTYTYPSVPPSGYGPSLLITDDQGCNNTNVIQPHIRMSLIPDFSGVGANPWTLCQDDPTDLLCGSGPDGAGITSDNWVSYIPPVYADTTFLPDGDGASYTTSIIFDQFTPFATLDDISLLGGIWLSMEHSYMGDFIVTITCPPPASNSVTMHQQGGGGTFLGVPIDDDSNLDIGECWEYGWTPDATNGTWVDNSGGTLPAGTYESLEPLNNLLGCPLNGQWTITITDNWLSDNGYICAWWIDWDQSLYPSPWEYSMSYTPVSWTAPQTNGEVLSGATGSCNGVGTYHSDLNITSPEPRPFTYTVVDNFGCVYDTTIQVTWLEDDATQCCIDPTPDLGSSDVICGLVYDLHVYNGFTTPGNTGEWAQVSGPGTSTFTPDEFNLNPVIEVSTPGIYTYSWTEVNGGCTTTVNKQVEFKLKPNAYAGADHDICGTHDNLSATSSDPSNTFYWYSVPSTGVSFGSQNSQNTTVDVTNYGMHSFYVVESNGTCSDTARIKINFMEIPNAIAYGNDTCGNTALLHADTASNWGPFYSGYWTGPLGAYYDPSDTAVNVYVTILPFVDPTFNETFTWHVTNGICSDEADVAITFNNGGPSAYPGNNDHTCLPDYQMHALPSVDGSPTVWSWTDNRLTVDNIQDTATWIHIDPNLIDFTDSSQVEFILNWTVDNSSNGGCFVTSWINITFFDTPEADAGPDRPICGLRYQLGATPSIAAWQGEWTVNTDSMPAGASVMFGDGSAYAQTQAVTEVHVTEYGVYQFIWHEQNFGDNTCNDADTVTIEFIRVPEVNAGDDDYVCGWRYQMQAQMDASGTSAYGTWQNAPIHWTDSTFYYDTPNTTTPIVQDPAQQVRPDALITLPVPEHYCEDSVMMVWQEYSIGTVFSHQCVAKDTTVIHFYADIQADNSTVSVEPEVCGREIDLTNAQDIYCAEGYWIDSLSAVVQWDPDDHNANTTATVGSFITDAFAYVIENGHIPGSQYPVCQDTSDFVTVTFKQKPQVDACPGCYRLEHGVTSLGDYVDSVRTDTVCFETAGEFYILNPSINIGQGSWSKASSGVEFANGIGSGNVSQTKNDSVFVLIWNSAGVPGNDYYTLVWTGTNSVNGCEDKDTLLLSIAKNPSGNIGFRRPYCNGESAKIWAEPDNDANPTDWNWQFTDNPVVDSTESGPYLNVDSLKQGSHYVRWTNSGDCDELYHVASLVSSSDWGCFSSSNSETIKEPGIVYPQFDNIAATCGQNNGMIKVLKDTITVCGDTIDHTIMTCWQSSTLVQDDENGIPAFSEQINYGANCVIDSIYGLSPNDTSVIAVDYISLITLDPGYVGPQVHCKDTLILRVEDSGHIEAVIDDGRIDDLNEDVSHIGSNLTGTAPLDVTLYHGTADASRYNWIIRDEQGNIIYDSSDEYPTYTFPKGNYEIDLVVKSREGCYDTTAYRFIMVDSESFIEIPNLFTPNGDGTNDYFQVYAKSLKAFKGFIMNRWGKVLYEWDDWTTEDKGWDGRINGNNYAAPGVYFYVIRYKGVYDDDETEVKGSVELVREKE